VRLPDLAFESPRPLCRYHQLPLLRKKGSTLIVNGQPYETIEYVCPSEQHSGPLLLEDKI
jgi:hypothetical protein